jgi:hypothetical protein
MICDINRSIKVGLISSLVIFILAYIFVDTLKKLDGTKLLFIFVIFFVIATSMDYFNYCYTKCDSVSSSITYGLFTVALVYFFYNFFVEKLAMNTPLIFIITSNVIILTLLHYFLCNVRNVRTNVREQYYVSY